MIPTLHDLVRVTRQTQHQHGYTMEMCFTRMHDYPFEGYGHSQSSSGFRDYRQSHLPQLQVFVPAHTSQSKFYDPYAPYQPLVPVNPTQP